MKIERILLSGFRGFHEPVDIPLAPGFTVIDGRNGVGKSTLFDAVEFALTGQITKYGNMTAGGESIEDYIWWKGDGALPAERFVEVTFTNGEVSIPLRRTPFVDPDPERLRQIEAGMVDVSTAPPSPLLQLCAASIIRDEYIASLSLDLSETQRYAKLRQAIGASDADTWTKRGSTLLGIADKRSEQYRAEVTAANAAVTAATRRIDEIRASLAPETAIAEATATMARLLAQGSTPPDQLRSPARQYVAQRDRDVRDLTAILDGWENFERDAVELADLDARVEAGQVTIADAQARRSLLPNPEDGTVGTPTADLVAQLHELRNLGTRIGLIEHHCPLCATDHDDASFAAGLARAAEFIDRIDARASEAAAEVRRRREAITAADLRIAEAQRALSAITSRASAQRQTVEMRRRSLTANGLAADAPRAEVNAMLNRRRLELEQARHALGVLDTLSLNQQLETATAELEQAGNRLARAQDRAGRARRARATAAALHDAARRAVSETLDLRLERMLPLMAELYGRLRPHPVWQDIAYAIRGDVRKFLSLQVGDSLNPQFLFSSGQRRVTGLAFLLSTNLSLTWSRWQSILLDDPVQHVDDFRAVNLAEVLAQLVAGGRQVIVAIEDAALADLLTRRMPVSHPGQAVRLTLGLGSNGYPGVAERRDPVPMVRGVLAA